MTASVTDDIPAVFGEADRRDPGRERTWIALLEGNSTQIDAVTAEAGDRRGLTMTFPRLRRMARTPARRQSGRPAGTPEKERIGCSPARRACGQQCWLA